MPHLPLNIDMHDRAVLIVGGGRVAGRKARVLLGACADVRVVALGTAPEIEALAADGKITLRLGHYDPDDLKGIFLVVVATDDPETNRRIASDARRCGILVAVADAPELGNCFFPAVLRRGSLEIGVSSGGRCPAFAAQVRDVIAGLIGDDYGTVLEHLATEREKLLTEGNQSTYNRQIVRALSQRLIAGLSDKELP